MKTHPIMTLAKAKELFRDARPYKTFVAEWLIDGKTYNVNGAGGKVKAKRFLNYIKMLEDKAAMVEAGIPDHDAFNRLVLEQNDGAKDPVRRRARGPGFASAFPNGQERKVKLRVYEYLPREKEMAAEDYRETKKLYPFTCRVTEIHLTENSGTLIASKTQPCVVNTAYMGRVEMIHMARQAA
jgi:hypothetical protein